jgi:hypothetical protein
VFTVPNKTTGADAGGPSRLADSKATGRPRRSVFSLLPVSRTVHVQRLTLAAVAAFLALTASGCRKQESQPPMNTKTVAQQQITIGQKTVVEGPSPDKKHRVVFEDDGDTGYFYALDMSRTDNPIVDALHIYTVTNVTDRHLPSTVQIVWSSDDLKALLLINRYPHAVFDFTAKRGYCRTGFPPPAKDGWTQHGHEWDAKVVELFP